MNLFMTPEAPPKEAPPKEAPPATPTPAAPPAPDRETIPQRVPRPAPLPTEPGRDPYEQPRTPLRPICSVNPAGSGTEVVAARDSSLDVWSGFVGRAR